MTYHEIRDKGTHYISELGHHAGGANASTPHLRREEFVGEKDDGLEASSDGHLPNHGQGYHGAGVY